ncbi:MAG: aldo/keto reductase [Bacteroidetes bacterium]|nr:aldo/keto reductase [Bacteroidota bacterium]
MNYSKLGASDLRISRIGFGCMSLGEEREASRLIHRAIEGGINFFDTADLYDKGLNEEMVGRILRDRRTEVVIATKVGNQWREDGNGWDWNPRKEYILKAVEESLRRLQTDRIDLYQLHGGTLEDPIDETIEAFELLQQQGKIRYYGISSIRPNVIREYVRRSKIVSVMMQYSLLDRRPEEECLDLLRESGIGVLARGALGKGLLAGKGATSYLDRNAGEVERAAKAVGVLAGGTTKADIALRYVLENPAVTSAIVGVRTESQLKEILSGNGEGRLGKEEMEELRLTLSPNRYEAHR